MKATLTTPGKKQFSVLAQLPSDDDRYIPVDYPRGSTSVRMHLDQLVTIIYQLPAGDEILLTGILRGGENRTRYELKILLTEYRSNGTHPVDVSTIETSPVRFA